MSITPKEFEHCLRCGRKLKNQNARLVGMGKICLEKSQKEQELNCKPLFEVEKCKA